MLWILFLVLTIVFWGTYNLFFKALSNQMNYFLALLIIGLCQVLVALPFVIYEYYHGGLTSSLKGYALSALMGIILGLGTIFFFYTFKYGASSSVAIPIYAVGALLIGFVGSLLLFKEPITFRLILGVLLGIASIILLTLK